MCSLISTEVNLHPGPSIIKDFTIKNVDGWPLIFIPNSYSSFAPSPNQKFIVDFQTQSSILSLSWQERMSIEFMFIDKQNFLGLLSNSNNMSTLGITKWFGSSCKNFISSFLKFHTSTINIYTLSYSINLSMLSFCFPLNHSCIEVTKNILVL